MPSQLRGCYLAIKIVSEARSRFNHPKIIGASVTEQTQVFDKEKYIMELHLVKMNEQKSLYLLYNVLHSTVLGFEKN